MDNRHDYGIEGRQALHYMADGIALVLAGCRTVAQDAWVGPELEHAVMLVLQEVENVADTLRDILP